MRNEDQFETKWGLLQSWNGFKTGEETTRLNVRWVATVAGPDHDRNAVARAVDIESSLYWRGFERVNQRTAVARQPIIVSFIK